MKKFKKLGILILVMAMFIQVIPMPQVSASPLNYIDLKLYYNDDTEVEHPDWYNLLRKDKFSNENPLKIKLKQSFLLDQDYDIKVKIARISGEHCSFDAGKTTCTYDNYTEVYDKTFSDINGLLLNNGYFITLDTLDYTLFDETMDNPTYSIDYAYKFFISIDDEDFSVTGNDRFVFKEPGETNLFLMYDNGNKNLNIRAGESGSFGGFTLNEVPKDYIDADRNLYIHSYGKNYDESKTYTYYNYLVGNEWWNEDISSDLLATGDVSGSQLNTTGLIYEISGTNLAKINTKPTFLQVIKDSSGKVVSISGNHLQLTNNLTLLSAQISSNGKNVFQQVESLFSSRYLSTNIAPIQINLHGIGFEDKDYDYKVIIDEICTDSICGPSVATQTGKIKGKDINDGETLITLDQITGIDYDLQIIFLITDSEGNGSDVMLELVYVASSDYFNTTNYFVDNNKDIIKNIGINTNADSMINNMSSSYNLSIYDQNNNKVANTAKVGTGMFLRASNEHDNPLFEGQLAVKGDVTGDGDISLTDVVKIKRHAADLEELQDIYEVAGNITGSGNIGLTDVVKMSRHYSGLETIQ